MQKLIEQLRGEGFEGFVTVSQLTNNPDMVRADGGVYLVLYGGDEMPEFREVGTGGHFKDKDPNVAIEDLKLNWVAGERILYIGKAESLRRRLRQYMKFGNGEDVGHWGGRLIWQIADAQNLTVCWKHTDENPREVEKRMIAEFKNGHNGLRPFANLQG